MATWYKKEMGMEPEASRETGQITAALDRYISASEDPDGKGVLRHFDAESRRVTIFFTPETGRLAQALGAEPCERPVNDGHLHFFGGDSRIL